MALYVIGYPVGGVIGGFAAQSWLLVDYDWRAVFLFGAVVTAVMIPLVMLLVPETPAFYAARRPEGALDKINRSLRALRKPPIDDAADISPTAPKPKVTDILSNPRLRPVTLLLAFGYMFHTHHVLLHPQVRGADRRRLPASRQPEAASTLTWANIGGAIGGALFGFLMTKWDIKGPTIAAAVLGSVAVVSFGMGSDTLWGWRVGHVPDDVLPQRRDRRLLRRLRARLPGLCPRHRHRLRARRRPRRRGGLADHRRLPVHRARQRAAADRLGDHVRSARSSARC